MALSPVLALVGLVVGFLVGLSGMGGASLMAPILILFGFRPLAVVGTDLAYSTITKLVGSAHHIRYGKVDFRTVRFLAFGSVPGCLFGIVTLTRIPALAVDRFIVHALGICLLLVALTMLVRAIFPQLRPFNVPPLGLSALGFLVGFLVSITSVGSGTLVVAVLAMGTSLSSRELVGTDLVHAFLLVLVATLGHWRVGSIDFLLSANLLIGALPGVLIGSRLSGHLPEPVLRPTLALVLFVAGVQLI